MSGNALHRHHRPSRVVRVARLTALTVVASLGIVLTPVISTGSAQAQVEPTIVEESVTPTNPTVSAEFDLAGVVLPPGSEIDSVEVRVRGDDGWSDWTTLEVMEADAGPDRGTQEHSDTSRVTEPVLAAGSSEIEVRAPGAESAEVVLIDGGDAVSAPAMSASAAPLVTTRAAWGADNSLMNCTPTRLPGYRGAVVHHTVNANTYSAAQAPALVRSIYAYHTTTLGWCDVGYQFLVDRFGTIYEGRSGAIERAVIGAQSAGFNAQTFGVSIMGDFTTATPSAASMAAVDSVIQWQLGLDGIDPSGYSNFTSVGNGKYPAGAVVRLPNVMGHRDNGQTACPGARLYALLPTFRKPLSVPVEPDPRVERQAGSNRYVTSARISEQAFPGPVPVAYLASGINFPDALSGAPAAATRGGPLLITHPEYLPDVILTELSRLQPQEVVVLGNSGAVSVSVVETIREATGASIVRLGGPDRYATSAMISAQAFPPGPPVAFIATGVAFPDALSGGPAAAALGGPLLLTHPQVVPEVIAAELSRLQPGRIVVLGSHDAASDQVMETLRALTAGDVTRVAGPSRYHTSALVSMETFPPRAPVAYVATGRNFPDALSGAPAAAALGGPLLITDPYEISSAVAEELRRLQPDRIVVLGSHPTVSRRVHLALAEFLS